MPVLTDITGELAAAVDRICDADPALLADGESIVALHRQLDRLEAATTRATAAFDAGGAWEADGARSAAAWVATRCHEPLGLARRRVRVGRALRAMPACEQAWLEGGIGEAQVEELVSVRRRVGEDRFDPDEAVLVHHARALPYRHFGRVVAYWVQAADPDGAEADTGAQREGRRLHLSESFGGTWFLDAVLDPISGEAVSRVLGRIEDELFEADWAEAKQERGDEAGGDDLRAADLARTPAQRRADALVEMARRAGAVPAGSRLPEPLLNVLVGYETLAGRVCELAGGTVVTPGALLPWLSTAWVERAVFDGPDRVKGVGVRRRLFAGATRRAVEVRDRTCFSEYCDVPAQDCEIDHVLAYGAGGATAEGNGRPACAYHHRLRHRPP